MQFSNDSSFLQLQKSYLAQMEEMKHGASGKSPQQPQNDVKQSSASSAKVVDARSTHGLWKLPAFKDLGGMVTVAPLKAKLLVNEE